MSFRSRISQRAAKLLDFCRDGGYNKEIAILVDMGRHSGLNRFVVWSFGTQRPIMVCPVSHGSGSAKSHQRSAHARFSNDEGTHLSSLGRALIAERYEGCYGVAYRLDGLDKTNSNLRSRCVVLHGWKHTTSFPIYPLATVGSFGCPVLSRKMLARVDRILQDHSRVVMEIFQ